MHTYSVKIKKEKECVHYTIQKRIKVLRAAKSRHVLNIAIREQNPILIWTRGNTRAFKKKTGRDYERKKASPLLRKLHQSQSATTGPETEYKKTLKTSKLWLISFRVRIS